METEGQQDWNGNFNSCLFSSLPPRRTRTSWGTREGWNEWRKRRTRSAVGSHMNLNCQRLATVVKGFSGILSGALRINQQPQLILVLQKLTMSAGVRRLSGKSQIVFSAL
jgi:hypothetical protein